MRARVRRHKRTIRVVSALLCCLGLATGLPAGRLVAASSRITAVSPGGGEIVYRDFRTVDDLQLNGAARQVGRLLRLESASATAPAEGGSAFAVTPIPTTRSFHTSFQFFLHDGSSSPADGVAFVLQNAPAGPATLGEGGNYLGYGGVAPSVAVSFHLLNWQNDACGSGDSFISFLVDGRIKPCLAVMSPPFGLYGRAINAWIDYTAPTSRLVLFASTTATKPAVPLLSSTFDIASHVGNSAYVGFSAGVGAYTVDADILRWHFVSVRPSSASPAPALTTLLPGPNTLLTGPVLPFRWTAFPRAAFYDLQVWLVRAYSSQPLSPEAVTVIAKRLTGTSYTLTVRALPKGVYRWSMAAADASGTLISAWTKVQTVTIP